MSAPDGAASGASEPPAQRTVAPESGLAGDGDAAIESGPAGDGDTEIDNGLEGDGVARIAFGTDEVTDLTRELVASLVAAGHRVDVVADGIEWPDAGRAVGEAVASGRAEVGIVCCWTGTGVSIAANKVPGVRAALCTDAATATGARRWNDANVLAFGLRLTTPTVAAEMVEAFLTTPVDAGEDGRIARVEP